ncbi:DHH family phosphoesterase [Candidatus Chloroploca asiatica]|nr:bifunctional oligoribonuclease/PAP phosphatase NrnA [Candidatus Chloroploca asiatica]
MMIYSDPTRAAPAFRAQIDQAQHILLLTHVNPDGDAIGSMLGAFHALRDVGKQVTALASSAIPDYTRCLAGIDEVQIYQRGSAFPEVDLIWMLDTAALSRVGAVFDDHEAALAARPLIITDHHVTNDGGGVVNLIDPSAASTAELLFRLLQAMELPIRPAAATSMLLGLTTDTQSFQTSSTSPRSLRIAADMLEAGADQRTVISAIYFSVPESVVRLSALTLSGMQREDGLIWTTVTQQQMASTRAGDEAPDDAIRQLQRVEGMQIAALFKERFDGTVKLSLRSIPGIDVAAIARTWGGGGHKQAAGATLPMKLEEAQATVLPLLRAAIEQAQ